MAILRILVIVAVILAICDSSLAKKSSKERSIKPLSNKALKRGLILQDTRDKFSSNPPTLAADSYEPFEEDGEKQCIDVLANDYDYEGNLDKSSLEIYEYPKHGVATINNKGEVCYKPKAQFHGSDIFAYSVCDTNDKCEWAAIRVRVDSVNDAPLVRDDDAVVGEDDYSVTIDVLANDEDVDGLYVNFASLKVVEQPTNGVVTKTSDHKFIYTPNWNEDTRYFGEDGFIYQICDSENPNLCSYGKVSIDVKDKCLACEHCNDLLPTFNYHAKRIQHVFESTVMSDI